MPIEYTFSDYVQEQYGCSIARTEGGIIYLIDGSIAGYFDDLWQSYENERVFYSNPAEESSV